ncbi:hypothetical protein Ga0074812_12328 [Parafrankia irregularis]|uniref:Uncharacterized protein n=1 Tax=Parafrankia irregularis TaxID=795642 RepID=A0A0S4QUB8_9ACTN|nr:hypothetical protein Ga0074812_12328 [Parafrankia irregularis]
MGRCDLGDSDRGARPILAHGRTGETCQLGFDKGNQLGGPPGRPACFGLPPHRADAGAADPVRIDQESKHETFLTLSLSGRLPAAFGLRLGRLRTLGVLFSCRVVRCGKTGLKGDLACPVPRRIELFTGISHVILADVFGGVAGKDSTRIQAGPVVISEIVGAGRCPAFPPPDPGFRAIGVLAGSRPRPRGTSPLVPVFAPAGAAGRLAAQWRAVGVSRPPPRCCGGRDAWSPGRSPSLRVGYGS